MDRQSSSLSLPMPREEKLEATRGFANATIELRVLLYLIARVKNSQLIN